MHACGHCGGWTTQSFRFCPWCATPQRTKLVEFFAGAGEETGKALRVSRYVVEGHVRFSVWDESGTAEAAVSIDEHEARRLAGFLAPPARMPSLLERFRLCRGNESSASAATGRAGPATPGTRRAPAPGAARPGGGT